MATFFRQFASNKWTWVSVIAIGLAFESVALYYEHALGMRPCSLCIHSRLWIALLIVGATVGLLVREYLAGRVVASVVSLGAGAGLLRTSWQLLGTERGWYFGSCGSTAGLPSWFELDAWLPWLFGVKDACGRTPKLLFGVTMAEGLFVFGIAVIAFGLVALVSAFMRRTKA